MSFEKKTEKKGIKDLQINRGFFSNFLKAVLTFNFRNKSSMF
jgi:hypothetical protein